MAQNTYARLSSANRTGAYGDESIFFSSNANFYVFHMRCTDEINNANDWEYRQPTKT